MVEVTVIKEVSGALPLTRKEIAYIAQKTLICAGISRPASFALVIINTAKIKRLNRLYRKKNKDTDILSFPLDEYKDKKLKQINLGDIFINPEYIEKASIKEGRSKRKHHIILLIHGILHLVGYDHISEKDFEKMYVKEEKAYSLVKKYLKLSK